MKQSASHSISRLYSIQRTIWENSHGHKRTNPQQTRLTKKNAPQRKKQTPRFTVLSCTQNVFYSAISIKIFFGQEKKRFYIFALAPRRTLSGVTPMDLFFCMIMTRVKFPPCFSANRRELVFRKLDCPSIDKDYFWSPGC